MIYFIYNYRQLFYLGGDRKFMTRKNKIVSKSQAHVCQQAGSDFDFLKKNKNCIETPYLATNPLCSRYFFIQTLWCLFKKTRTDGMFLKKTAWFAKKQGTDAMFLNIY